LISIEVSFQQFLGAEEIDEKSESGETRTPPRVEAETSCI